MVERGHRAWPKIRRACGASSGWKDSFAGLASLPSLDLLLEAFRRDPNRCFTAAEAAILREAAATQVWAAKAMLLHLYRSNDLEAALPLARLIVERAPDDESVINLVAVLRGLGRTKEAIRILEASAALVDRVRYHDMACSLYARIGRPDDARRHGTLALQLKDAAAPPIAATAPLVMRRFDPERPNRHVIAFSVWGANARYLQGAVTNAIVARYLYPGWTARFYVDGSVPEGFRDALLRHGAQVVIVSDLPADIYGLFWRFLVEDDEEVDIYLVRDADSVVNIKERSAVAAWLRGNRAFHVMRDHVGHSELVLAGLWGAHRGNIGRMRQRILDFVAAMPSRANYIHKDQHFLRQVVWPIMRGSVIVHDGHFAFGETKSYDPDYALPRRMHIGQNDWIHYRPAAGVAKVVESR